MIQPQKFSCCPPSELKMSYTLATVKYFSNNAFYYLEVHT